MRLPVHHVVIAIAVAACSGQHHAPASSNTPSDTRGKPASETGAQAAAGVNADPPAAVDAGASNAAGSSAGRRAPDEAGAGNAANAGAGAGAGAGGASGSQAPASVPVAGAGAPSSPKIEPLIPEPRGECPKLITGSATVMGTQVEILAGAPPAMGGPVLLAWHPTTATGRDAINFLPASVKTEIEAAGGVVFAPTSNGKQREGDDTTGAQRMWFTSDFALADELVACAHKHHGIDPRRIYTTGCVAGGLMAGALAIARSSYIAAAALNSGGLFTNDAILLQDPKRVPSVVNVYGTSELIVTFSEQYSRTIANAIDVAGGFAVECPVETTQCAAPAEQERAWKFLKAHPFGVAPFPYARGLPADYPETCRFTRRDTEQRACTGTHAPCSTFAPSDEPTYCTRHGCTWQAGACTGTPHACAAVQSDQCSSSGSAHAGCHPS